MKRLGIIFIILQIFLTYAAYKGGFELHISANPEEALGAILGAFPLATIGIILIAMAYRKKKRDEKNGVVRDKGSLR